MASTFTTNKTLELPANGDYVNTWNIPVNSDMTVIDTALGGTTSLNATAGSATLTYTQYRPLILSVSGAVSANVTYTIPSGVGGQWIVRNAMTDSSGGPWDLIFASGGGGTSVIVSRGYTTTIYSDGTNISYSDSRLSTAAGSNRQIQYNNNGVLGASSTFVYDTGGNVGIGGTPSAWANGSYALQVGSGASMFSNNVVYSYFSTNGYFDGTNWRYIGTGASAQYVQSAGANIWYYAASGTAGNTFAWQEAMRIDASGNVGIGTASPGVRLDVNGALRVGLASNPTTVANNSQFYDQSGVGPTISGLSFTVRTGNATPTESMRIDSSGNVGIGTGPGETIGATLEVRGAVGTALRIRSILNSVEPTGYYSIGRDTTDGLLKFNGAQTTFVGYKFFNTGSEVMRIDSNGDMQVGTTSNINNARISVQNSLNCYVAYTTNNSYTTFQGFGAAGTGSSTFYVLGSGQIYSTSTSIIAISDQTLKANIKPLETGLAEVLALKPRRFDWSEKSINEGRNIAGFIAQEVQAVLPDLIAPYQYGKDETKLGLKMGDMIPTLVAAIQELAAKVAALEGK